MDARKWHSYAVGRDGMLREYKQESFAYVRANKYITDEDRRKAKLRRDVEDRKFLKLATREVWDD